MTIWGNHSSTQYPDIFHAKVRRPARYGAGGWGRLGGEEFSLGPAAGGRRYRARGASSAASGANAVRRYRKGLVARYAETATGRSMAVAADGSYGTPEGIYCSFPVVTGEWGARRAGLEVNEFSADRIERSTAELVEERESVAYLGLLP